MVAMAKKKLPPPKLKASPKPKSGGRGLVAFVVIVGLATAAALVQVRGKTGWQRLEASGLPARGEAFALGGEAWVRQRFVGALERYRRWQAAREASEPVRQARAPAAPRHHAAAPKPKESLGQADRAALDKLVSSRAK